MINQFATSKCVCPTNKTSKYTKQKLTKLNGDTTKFTIIVGMAEDVNTPLSGIDKTSI